jgi:hypothetical protein
MLIHSQKSLWPIAGNGIAYVLLRPFRLTAIIEPNRIAGVLDYESRYPFPEDFSGECG